MSDREIKSVEVLEAEIVLLKDKIVKLKVESENFAEYVEQLKDKNTLVKHHTAVGLEMMREGSVILHAHIDSLEVE